MSKKEEDKSKDSQGLQGAIKRFLRVKGGSSCESCKIIIEEVEEEKTEDEAKTTGKKQPNS